MGIDARPDLRGVFYTEVEAKRSYFMDFFNSERVKYILSAFVRRSDAAKFFTSAF